MRISQNMIYSGAVRHMNSALGKLTEASEQNASQQRINRPSDDPVGYAQARKLDSIISNLSQYSDNVDTARSWLKQADSTLLEASTVMTSVKELATQAATGTATAENRQEIATQVRQLYQELLSLSNTSVSGNSLFAGQKTSSDAFKSVLGATVQDANLTSADVLSVTGESDTSLLVQFTENGTVGGAADLGFRYSADGGSTWTTGTLAAGSDTLTLGGCTVTMRSGAAVTGDADGGGTALILRPSALYLGDDQDGCAVRAYGGSPVTATAQGSFTGNVAVRIDAAASIPGAVSYSYSLDGGRSWASGNTASGARLPVPGGYLELASNGGTALAAGSQFTIVPDTADINVRISPTSQVAINNVGKDVFGGMYQSVGASNASVVFADQPDQNIFETVGELIGYLETNNTEGIGNSLDKLTAAQAHLETCAADVGGRENRLDFAENTLSVLTDNSTSQLSTVEDADLSQLLLDLSKYQYAYESVLSSSSKIMGMSLLDYM